MKKPRPKEKMEKEIEIYSFPTTGKSGSLWISTHESVFLWWPRRESRLDYATVEGRAYATLGETGKWLWLCRANRTESSWGETFYGRLKGGFKLEYDSEYGIDKRTGWSVAIDGICVVQFQRFLLVALAKAAWRCWRRNQ